MCASVCVCVCAYLREQLSCMLLECLGLQKQCWKKLEKSCQLWQIFFNDFNRPHGHICVRKCRQSKDHVLKHSSEGYPSKAGFTRLVYVSYVYIYNARSPTNLLCLRLGHHVLCQTQYSAAVIGYLHCGRRWSVFSHSRYFNWRRIWYVFTHMISFQV